MENREGMLSHETCNGVFNEGPPGCRIGQLRGPWHPVESRRGATSRPEAHAALAARTRQFQRPAIHDLRIGQQLRLSIQAA